MPAVGTPRRLSSVRLIVRSPSTTVLLAIGTATVWVRTPGANVSVVGVRGPGTRVKSTSSVPAGVPRRWTVIVAEPAISDTE